MPSRIPVSLTQINIKTTARKLIIPFSFILPVLVLYVLDPSYFELFWKECGPLTLLMASSVRTSLRMEKAIYTRSETDRNWTTFPKLEEHRPRPFGLMQLSTLIA